MGQRCACAGFERRRARREESGRCVAPRWRFGQRRRAPGAFSPSDQPRDVQDLLFAYLSIAVPDPAFAEMKAQTLNLAPDDQRPELAMLRAQTMDHRRWLQLNEAREQLRWAWRDFFDEYDVLLAPILRPPRFRTTMVHSDRAPSTSMARRVRTSSRCSGPVCRALRICRRPSFPPAPTRRGCRSACRSSVRNMAIESPSALRGCSKPKASHSRRRPPMPELRGASR